MHTNAYICICKLAAVRTGGDTHACVCVCVTGPLWDVISQKLVGGSLQQGSEMVLEVAEARLRDVHVEGSLLVSHTHTHKYTYKRAHARVRARTHTKRSACGGKHMVKIRTHTHTHARAHRGRQMTYHPAHLR